MQNYIVSDVYIGVVYDFNQFEKAMETYGGKIRTKSDTISITTRGIIWKRK